VSVKKNILKVGIAQIAPVWLNKVETRNKILEYISKAGNNGCELLIFGEAFLPGYPFWLSLTHGSKFDSIPQKEIHAHYARNSVSIEEGDLNSIFREIKKQNVSVYLGFIERAADRGGHSLYCSLAFIDKGGEIRSVHRKLQPTYEERLSWAQGDGNGLRVHKIKEFSVGGLNCWENWMPLARTALYGMGENLHVAVWPGSERNTKDITRFIAKESRSFVVSASGLMRISDFPADTPHIEEILKHSPKILADGGSCIAGPDGKWVIEPQVGEEKLITAEIDINRVFEERQNFDPSGHYSRPDVMQLKLNRERQSIINK
jgi:nitrilase